MHAPVISMDSSISTEMNREKRRKPNAIYNSCGLWSGFRIFITLTTVSNDSTYDFSVLNSSTTICVRVSCYWKPSIQNVNYKVYLNGYAKFNVLISILNSISIKCIFRWGRKENPIVNNLCSQKVLHIHGDFPLDFRFPQRKKTNYDQ